MKEVTPLQSDDHNEHHTPSTSPATARRRSRPRQDYLTLKVDRLLRMITLANESPDGVAAAELPRLFQVSARTVDAELRALVRCRCLERDPATGRFHTGVTMALHRVHRIQLLAHHARPGLERLRDQLGETTNLAVLDGTCLDVRSFAARRPVRFVLSDVDQRLLFGAACGKATLSRLPDERVRDLLHLPAGSASGYLSELAEIRRRGYAIDDLETVPDGRCVAVPVLAFPVPAAISVSAPAARLPLTRVPHIADRLHETARALVRLSDRGDST